MNKAIEPLVASVGILALLFLYLAGLGYRTGAFELGQAFTLMRWAAYAGVASLALVIFYILWRRPLGLRLGVLFLSALMGLAAFYLPYRQQQIAAGVPPIHDISTNTEDPPAFLAVAPLRPAGANPLTYDGEETARLQREAYPDLMTMTYARSPDEVFEAALEVAGEMDWELVDANREDGRIEATATTRWFGFKDDVVVRLLPGPAADSTLVDVRSKSRVGRSDIGVNAARIRAFREALNERLT